MTQFFDMKRKGEKERTLVLQSTERLIPDKPADGVSGALGLRNRQCEAAVKSLRNREVDPPAVIRTICKQTVFFQVSYQAQTWTRDSVVCDCRRSSD